MVGAIEVDVDATIADIATRKKRGKKNVKTAARKKSGKGPNNTDDGGNLPGSAGDQKDNGSPGIAVSLFDHSVENHFSAMDRICKLSGEAECDDLDKGEFERLSSSITFLREWKHFNYQPRVVQFACQSESSPQGKDVIGGITLPQFSAATVPKKDEQNGNVFSPESRKDFVMYVGGPVWALDWRPKDHQRSDCDITCEFIAIAAHPPESSYHKIGSPLIGRGIIQIWCLLHASKVEDKLPQLNKKPKQNPSKNRMLKINSAESKKPIGRPRKKPISESANNLNADNQFLEALGVQFPENSSNLPLLDMASKEEEVHQVNKKPQQDPSKSGAVNVKSTESKRARGRPRKKPINESANNLDGDSQFVQALGVQFPENSSELLPLDVISNEEEVPQVNKKPQQDPSKSGAVNVKSTESKRARGRPRKKPINESANNLDSDGQFVQALGVQFPENPSELLPLDVISNEEEVPQVNKRPQQGPSQSRLVDVKATESKRPSGRPRKKPINESANNLDGDSQFVQALSVQFPENSSELLPLDLISNEEEVPQVNKKPQQDASKSGAVNVKSTESKRARGRPRKKPINESANNIDGDSQLVQALGVQCPENSSGLPPVDIVSMDTHEHIRKEDSGRQRKGCRKGVSADNLVLTSSSKRRKLKDKGRAGDVIHGDGLPLLMQNENRASFQENLMICSNSEQGPIGSIESIPEIGSSESNAASNLIPEDVALPRIVLCLAHNGKVAWDVKWRPSNVYDTESKHRMGYLAVLLGNGALEVWEVPLPRTMKVIYSACGKEGTDPRFVKLEPVFRCSKLKCGDRQSFPLTVEWSALSPHDFILAGCHDGVVALWKFSANGRYEDTRPLLCFSADTVPIRALAWAPVESDAESANVIVTAGHRGLKFWDIRDPFRPLLDLNTVQRIVYSLDWLPDPRCVVLSFDDGTLRILSLVKAASDVPVTGKPFVGTQQQGFYSYYCSSFAIWSVQVSRLTGMVAYCSADGTVLRFQLTNRAVEKDPFRNRAPHFLCGSLSEEESTLTVVTPLSDTPFPMKKSLNEWGDAPRTIRGFLSVSNQAKRAKEQMAKCQPSDEQTLALCYGDDPLIESGSEGALMSQTSEQAPKSKTNNKEKQKAAQSLACSEEEEPENVGDGVKREAGDEIEDFPPKIVAMHRVRWNMNKGGERWLCYGGAGGIVRCQEIGNPVV